MNTKASPLDIDYDPALFENAFPLDDRAYFFFLTLNE